jgi:hypothetical protein
MHVRILRPYVEAAATFLKLSKRLAGERIFG